MDLKEALFRKRHETTINLLDYTDRFGKYDVQTIREESVYKALFEVVQDAGLEEEYHQWKAALSRKTVKTTASIYAELEEND